MRIFNLFFVFIKRIIHKIFCMFKRKRSEPIIQIDGMLFSAPSQLCAWRAKTLFKKEPQTIEWITRFESGDIFWDIGANVGVYSIYGAVKKDIKVYAFEPSPFNFHVLSKNIYLNKKSETISAFCLALSERTTIDYLNLKSIGEGAAHTSFLNTVNEFGESFIPMYSQSTLGFSVDEFIELFDLQVPNHIKIDVDGAEQFVINGALKTLQSPQLKSILIELNSDLKPGEQDVFDKISSSGFALERADHPDGDRRLANYIFRRI